jgi:Ca2+-binding RTX toxin-like protein
MYGGAGVDSVYYWDHTEPVTASIDGVSGNDGSAGEGDTIGADVENLYGGDGDDTLTGSDRDNWLNGGDGDDVISGGAGNDEIEADWSTPFADIIFGGPGIDTAVYRNATAAVIVDLDNVFGDDGASGEGDSAIDIENIVGTPVADILIGNAGNNVIFAGGGNDIVLGLDGDDRLSGTTGDDVLVGGNGVDILDGGAGTDRCNLGPGGLTTVSCER